MTTFPQWDAKVIWPTGPGVALDRVTGREAYYGPLGEGGTPDQNEANNAWGAENWAGWTQPDGHVVYYSPEQGWIEQLLAAIDAPLGLVNDQAMALWFQSEGIDPRANNPCATLAKGYGEHYEPPWAMPFYPTRFAGQRAWVDSVTRLVPGGLDIVFALQNQQTLLDIYGAIHASKWCPGCPNYPSAIYAQLAASGTPPPTSGGGTVVPQPAPGGGGTVTPVPPLPGGVTGTLPGGVGAPSSHPVPEGVQQGWNQVLTVVTETLPVATQVLDIIANSKIGGV